MSHEPQATELDEKAALAVQAQVAVSALLTLMMLSFTTARQGNDRRVWTFTLRETEAGPDVPLTIAVTNGVFTVVAAIRHGNLDPSEIYWKIVGTLPFVRVELHPPLLWLRADMPIDRNPPFILPETVQAVLQSVFSAVVFLVKEHPEHVHPEPLPPTPSRSDHSAVDA